ncbi:hypothetical protein [Mycobacterium avium]|uniref:hypothetical protein n=1 Tax=Mycobacterium avium TaxID=1764 RepID=UPI000ADFDBB7|nr:hypothetical protein [Mycobacterium avium]
MTQHHYDALGVWQTEPVSPFTGSSMVADLARTSLHASQERTRRRRIRRFVPDDKFRERFDVLERRSDEGETGVAAVG